MAKEIKDRYSCMADFANALSKIDLDRSSRPAGPMQRLQTSKDSLLSRSLTSNQWFIAVSATGVLCVLAVALWFLFSSPTEDTNLQGQASGNERNAALASPPSPNAPSSPTPIAAATPLNPAPPEPVGSWLYADLSDQGLAAAAAFQLQNDQSILLRGEGRNFSFATSAKHDVFKLVMEFRYPNFPLEALPRVIIGSDRPVPNVPPSSISSGVVWKSV